MFEDELDIAHILHRFLGVRLVHFLIVEKCDFDFSTEKGCFEGVGVNGGIGGEVYMIEDCLLGFEKLRDSLSDHDIVVAFLDDFTFECVYCV